MVKEPPFPCCLSVEMGPRLADRTGQLQKNETDTDERLLMAPSRSQRTAHRRSRTLPAQNFDHQYPGAIDDRDKARDIACSDPKKSPARAPAKSSAPRTTKANPKPTLMTARMARSVGVASSRARHERA